MSLIFVDPNPLREQAQEYRAGAEVVAAVSHHVRTEQTNMSSVLQYLEAVENFNACVTEFSNLLQKEANAVKSVIDEWFVSDQGISRQFTDRR